MKLVCVSAHAGVIVDLVVDAIELRTVDHVNGYVNDYGLPGRVGVAALLARQGAGLRTYVRATGCLFTPSVPAAV